MSDVCETQWELSSGMEVTLHQSEMQDAHIGLGFIQYNGQFKIDLTIDDALALRDELTRIATDVFRSDSSIKCPACGYTWAAAQFHCDHRNCRRYPFFPDERGQSYASDR